MSEPIHAHFVLNTLLAADKGWKRDELISAIRQQFGQDARFHTCQSAEGLAAEELVDFFIKKGRISNAQDGLRLNPKAEPCEHASRLVR